MEEEIEKPKKKKRKKPLVSDTYSEDKPRTIKNLQDYNDRDLRRELRERKKKRWEERATSKKKKKAKELEELGIKPGSGQRTFPANFLHSHKARGFGSKVPHTRPLVQPVRKKSRLKKRYYQFSPAMAELIRIRRKVRKKEEAEAKHQYYLRLNKKQTKNLKTQAWYRLINKENTRWNEVLRHKDKYKLPPNIPNVKGYYKKDIRIQNNEMLRIISELCTKYGAVVTFMHLIKNEPVHVNIDRPGVTRLTAPVEREGDFLATIEQFKAQLKLGI